VNPKFADSLTNGGYVAWISESKAINPGGDESTGAVVF
jgi:hypothetical protein